LIEPGQPSYDEVVQEFGQAVVAPGGRVDRAKLSAVVFADRAKLDRLNAIVHPRVAEVIFSQFEAWKRAGIRDAVFVEAALLVESGIHKSLDGLVVAWCRPEQQLERLLARGLSETEARRRIAAQLPVEEKLRLATEKIDCSGSLQETRRQVEALATKLRHSQTVP
jgi:dephospho-CoA kinase